MSLRWSWRIVFIRCVLLAAGARARAQSAGGSVSTQQNQAELVNSASCFQSHDPALPVERCSAPWWPLPVSTTFWVQRPWEQSRGPAAAGEYSSSLFHFRLMAPSTECSWPFYFLLHEYMYNVDCVYFIWRWTPGRVVVAKATAEGDPNKQQIMNNVTNVNAKPHQKLFVSYEEPRLKWNLPLPHITCKY